jgi:hypothetical protein
VPKLNLANVVPVSDAEFKETYAKFKAYQEHRDFIQRQSKLYFDSSDEF